MKEFTVMVGKTNKLLLFSIIAAMSLFLVWPNQQNIARAQEEDECSSKGWNAILWVKCGYEFIKGAIPDLDIRRTMFDSFASLLTDIPIYVLYGMSSDQVQACMIKIMSDPSGLNKTSCKPEDDSDLAKVVAGLSDDDCAALNSNPIAVAAGVIDPVRIKGGFAGSLNGLTMVGSRMIYNEPVPINMAYYARDVASRTAFLKNTAYAQPIQIETGTFIGFEIVLSLWRFVRNVAFGMMAVFMLIIGMMIMMRKQLDPRTSVTIQNALPRIVISLVLITFSYVIGALAVALILPLTSIALEPIRLAAEEAGVMGPALTWVALVWGAFSGATPTFVVVFLVAVVIFVIVVTLAILVFKAMMAYVRLLVTVLIGPLQIAWGAIPGNDDAIGNWFKSLAVSVLTVPAITAGISVGLYFAWTLVLEVGCSAYTSEAGGAGPFELIGALANENFTRLLIPILVMAIFIQAIKIPKKIEDALLGEKKKGKK